ncbi:MAG: hypothetical protein KKH98_04015 [Spirochaetes bacterium]|nr:hypothetical protein [Spirochaetota bacterium]
MKNFKLICVILLSLLVTIPAQAELIIDSIVGNGDAGYNGDGVKAENASLYSPMGVCSDEIGNVYIADSQNNRVRMIDTLGVINTVAGNGIFGYDGDERRAINCSFAFPMGVYAETIDKANKKVRLYIVDTRNNKIRMVNEYGIIRTIAGSGRVGYSGDNGPAEKADFAWPASVTLDKEGNVYIADTYNNKIRVIYRKGAIAGNGGNAIIKNPKPGRIYTLAGTGRAGYGGDTELANIANLRHPWDIAISGGEIFIADKDNHIVRKVGNNGIITTIAGIPGIGGYYGDVLKATEEKLNMPYGIWADASGVYVADAMNSRIRMIDPKSDKISTIVGIGEFGLAGDGAPAANSLLSHPVDIFGDGTGSFYICDLQNQRVRIVKPEGKAGGGSAQ